jgi:hypothetical protein
MAYQITGANCSRLIKLSICVILIFDLAGCNFSTSERFAERMSVDPAKYTFYKCDDLNVTLSGQKKREHELRRLMDKASRSPGGDFVNLLAYKAEFLRARGYQHLAIERQREMECGKALKRNWSLHY